MPHRKRRVAVLFSTAHQAYAQVLKGVSDFVHERRAWTLYVNPEPFINMALPSLAGWKGDGVLMRIMTKEDMSAARRFPWPVVSCAGSLDVRGLPSVTVDQCLIGRLAAEHLLDRGFRRFGYYGLKNTLFSDRRREGFVGRIQEAGGDCSVFEVPNYTNRRYPWHKWLKKLQTWLKALEKPVGIMAVHDPRASIVVDTCLEMELRVPEDVAVVGVENNEIVCRYASVPLTSVAPDYRRLGHEAAEMLDRLMLGQEVDHKPVFIPPGPVVERKSTEIMAIDDPYVAKAVAYLQENYADDITIHDLESIDDISRRNLERRFRKYLGRTPHQFLSRIRVEEAKKHLASNEPLRLEQIARRCGFTDTRHLRMTFRRLAGISPAEYRRQCETQDGG